MFPGANSEYDVEKSYNVLWFIQSLKPNSQYIFHWYDVFTHSHLIKSSSAFIMHAMMVCQFDRSTTSMPQDAVDPVLPFIHLSLSPLPFSLNCGGSVHCANPDRIANKIKYSEYHIQSKVNFQLLWRLTMAPSHKWHAHTHTHNELKALGALIRIFRMPTNVWKLHLKCGI